MAATKGPCPNPPQRREPNRKANLWVARVIPVLIFGLIAYACWVITHLICVDYLLNPPSSLQLRSQKSASISIIVILYILLTLMVTSYLLLIYTVTRNPGLVPRGPQFFIERARKRKEARIGTPTSRAADSQSPRHHEQRSKYRDGRSITHSRHSSDSTAAGEEKAVPNPKDLENASRDRPLTFDPNAFWHRTLFTCTPDGRPSFCSTCYAPKPDRAHHCSEVNRCVTKMDHFCPWVSGVVGENSFKYFTQFTFYAFLFCTHILVVTAYFFAQRRAHENDWVNGNWIAAIAASALFGLFAGGMCMSSCHFAAINSTTIENLSRKKKVWFVAVYMPPNTIQEAQKKGIKLNTITYPRPPEEQIQILERSGATDISPPSTPEGSGPQRTFAILETPPGSNPFDIGYLRNFQEIMGYTVWDWFIPYKLSPCVAHRDQRSLYKMGSVIDKAKRDTGIEDWEDEDTALNRRRSRRRSSQSRHQHRQRSRTHSRDIAGAIRS